MEVNQESLSAQVAVKLEPLSEDDESGNKSDMSDISKKPRQHLVLNALYGDACCCVCLCVDGAPDTQDNLNVRLRLGPGRAGSLHHMLEAVLRDKVLDLPETNFLCEKCTDATIRAYIFIQNAKDTMETLARHLVDLQGQVDHALHRVNRGSYVGKIVLSTDHPKVKIEPKTEAEVSENNVPQVNDQSDVTFNWEKEHMENTEERRGRVRHRALRGGGAFTRRGRRRPSDSCGLCPPAPAPAPAVAATSSRAGAGAQPGGVGAGAGAGCVHSRYVRWWRERGRAAQKRGVRCPDCLYNTNDKLTYIEHVSEHLRATPASRSRWRWQGDHGQGHSQHQRDVHIPLDRQTKRFSITPRPAICRLCREEFITATDFLRHRKYCSANPKCH